MNTETTPTTQAQTATETTTQAPAAAPAPAPKPVKVSLRAEHDLTLFASKDKGRYILNSVHYDATKKLVVATNGKMLATLPVLITDAEPGQTEPQSCTIGTDLFKRVMTQSLGETQITTDNDKPNQRKVSFRTADLSTEQTLNGHTLDGNFPNWEHVIPTQPVKLRIVLNEDLLDKIVKYARAHSDKKCGGIIFEFRDELTAVGFEIKTESGTCKGLLMPMRLS